MVGSAACGSTRCLKACTRLRDVSTALPMANLNTRREVWVRDGLEPGTTNLGYSDKCAELRTYGDTVAQIRDQDS